MKSVHTLANKTAVRAVKAEAKLAKAEAKLEACKAKLVAAKKIYDAAIAEAEHMGVYSGDTTGA